MSYKKQFSQVPQANIQRSTFNRSYTTKTTFNAGELIPIHVDEVLPGDTHIANFTIFGRLSTPIVPLMDDIFITTHSFFVPSRLVMDKFENLMGEQDNPGDSTDFPIPQLKDSGNEGFAVGSLMDYMGLPTVNQATGLEVSALPFRCYNLIWNEYYKDQNLQDSTTVRTTQGPDFLNENLYSVKRRGKRHDYFTSCLPNPQKGQPVDIPLGDSASVNITNLPVSTNAPGSALQMRLTGGGIPDSDSTLRFYNGGTVGYTTSGRTLSEQVDKYVYPTNLVASGTATADLSSASAISINQLRQAFALQRLAETNMRSGTRYIETIKAHFGVTSPDARLQRPEFLGGGECRLSIQPVPQTAVDASGGTPMGNLAAFGTFANQSGGFTKSFTEHGFIITLASARAPLTYQNGIHKMWTRRTRYDHYFPALANLGEQAVLNKEIFADGTETDDDVFGYQERWSEYRYLPNKITGKFRSNDPQSLDIWHLSQDFATAPNLNSDFIEDNPPIDRILAVQNEPQFIMDIDCSLKSARPMPTYSVPGLSDHL